MDSIKNIKKVWLGSLGFLDNCYVNSIIVIILLLYCSTIFENINSFIGNLYNFSIIKLAVLLAIVYVTPKDPIIGILLGLSYAISLNYLVNTENFVIDNPIEIIKNPSTKSESDDVKESFFPLTNISDYNLKKEHDTDNFKNHENKDHSCLNNYNAWNESVGDVCNPVATFQNELNAQGINDISGFNESSIKHINGSPI
jgi:hypothetical protein